MPAGFNKCVKSGGRVRTKTIRPGVYMHICFPKSGGPSIAGEVKHVKTGGKRRNAPTTRKGHAKRVKH